MSSFGNPRFMFDHLLRIFGTTFLTGPEDANFPLRRLVDGQNGPLWRGDDGSIDADVVVGRLLGTLFANRPPYQRIIIPTTLQSFNDSLQRIEIRFGAVNPPTEVPILFDGTDANFYPAPDVWDFELGVDVFETFFLAKFFNTIGDVVQEAGEIFASGIFEPSVGHIPVWEDVDEPNNLIATTSSGNTYALQRGDPRRVWRLRYERVPEDDVFQFDTLRRVAGIQLNGFWFDPPSRGDALELFVPEEDPSSLGTWTQNNIIFSIVVGGAGNNPPGSDSILQESVNTMIGFSQFDFNTPVDLRGRFLSVDIRAAIATPFDTPGSSGIAFSSDLFANRTTEFDLSRVHTLHTASADTWRRQYTDHTITLPFVSGSTADLTPDWSAINSIRLIMRPDVAGRFLRWENIDLVRKESRPTFVELLEYDKRQVSDNPSVFTKYNIELTLREVLS